MNARASRRRKSSKPTRATEKTDDERKKLWARLWISVGFLIPLMYLSMGHMLGLPMPAFFHGGKYALIFALTRFLLCLPVVIVNYKYFMGGFKSLFKGTPNMDTLIAVGAGAAFVYGVVALYAIGYDWDTEMSSLYRGSAWICTSRAAILF